MGATGSGKSTVSSPFVLKICSIPHDPQFINLASGSTLAVGHDLASCTAIMECSDTFELHGRRITLLDTPGFDDTTRSDTEVLRTIAAYLSTMYVPTR